MPGESPADQFRGAEESIDQQRMDALNALATLGRRGLQSAVDHKNNLANSNGGGTAMTNAAPESDTGLYNYKAIIANGNAAYNQDANRAAAFIGTENDALGQVNANYFDQARQAVPTLRTNAGSLVDQYRKAYEERQAQILADKAQRDMQLQMMQEQMAQQAAISAAQIAAINASGAGPLGPDPVLAAELAARTAPVVAPKAAPKPALKGLLTMGKQTAKKPASGVKGNWQPMMTRGEK